MRGNRLVDALPLDVAGRLWERGQVVPLHPGALVGAAGDAEGHTHFPLEGALTLRTVSGSAAGAGVLGAGGDGVRGPGTVGVAAVGPDSALVLPATPASALGRLQLVAATPGRALRVDAGTVDALTGHGGALRALLDAATGSLVAQLAQHVLCAQQHPLPARAGHWLGLVADRAVDPTPTQEWLAGTVGVAVEHVPALLAGLQEAGAVCVTERGVGVVDRALLAARSCDCAPVLAPALGPPQQRSATRAGPDPTDDRLVWLRALAAGVPVSSLSVEHQVPLPEMYRELAALYADLGVSSRTQAVLLAARRGWLNGPRDGGGPVTAAAQ